MTTHLEVDRSPFHRLLGLELVRANDGVVEMRLNDGGIDAAQEREGWVLTCQGEVRSATARIVYPEPE